jgi:hypothetical protein
MPCNDVAGIGKNAPKPDERGINCDLAEKAKFAERLNCLHDSFLWRPVG